jgi:pilus assembly protein CpaE
MIAHALRSLGYRIITAGDGAEGLKKAMSIQPEVIISDVVMPKMDGYELVKRLRRDVHFAHTPILMLTSASDLEDKLKSFEAGADDHMTKPFERAELVARISVLLRREQAFKAASREASPVVPSYLVAVHSLRGGTGCSSIAVNLALAFHGLWGKPTLLVDAVLPTGQIALMLNASLKRTWADISPFQPEEIDDATMHTIIAEHESGLHFIAAPTAPVEAEELTGELMAAMLKIAGQKYDYVVVDLAHDFSEVSLQVLDAAQRILLVMAPEVASVRAAAVALETYRQLGYEQNKVCLVLNRTFQRHGLKREQIEKALRMKIALILPFDPDSFVPALNYGRPMLYAKPDDRAAGLIENFAFRISREQDKRVPPPKPTAALLRVYKRLRSS